MEFRARVQNSPDLGSLEHGFKTPRTQPNDFTDLCVYTALADFILPKIADFGNEDNAERQKMGYYANKAESLFQELITAGDWYDFDNDSNVESTEKQPGQYNLKRVR